MLDRHCELQHLEECQLRVKPMLLPKSTQGRRNVPNAAHPRHFFSFQSTQYQPTRGTPTMKSKRESSRDRPATQDEPQDRRFAALCKTLAADPKFARAIGEHAANRVSPTRQRFGSNALKVNEKIFAMMSQGTVVVKLPRARVDELVEAGSGTRFDPGHGRVMKEWLAVSAPTRLWAALVREAHDFVAGGTTRDRAKGV
jgi:hypothetical protein